VNVKKLVTLLIVPALLAPAFSLAADRFDEKDFNWDPWLEHYKRIVIAGVNKVARENPNCATLDPTSIERYGGTPDDPEFVVTCGEPDHITHAYFSKTDVTGDPASDVPLDEKPAH
jgi:hypothetical protein